MPLPAAKIAEPPAQPAVKQATPASPLPAAPKKPAAAATTPAAATTTPAARATEPPPVAATKPAAPPPLPPATAAATPATAAPGAKKPVLPAAAAATPTLDLNGLTEEVKSTSAIGFFTKLTLKNQVDDLLDKVRDYHASRSKLTLMDLRRSYDLLLMKVLSLLQDKEPTLASAIVSSREAIWELLADPRKFATLKA
jgi:hypothetical protein